MAAHPPNLNDWYSRQGMQVNGGGLTIAGGGSIKGGQTGYDLGNGFFIGYSGTTYKFSVGNSAGNKITWDGTNLTVTGTISASAFDTGTTGYVRGGKTNYATGTGFWLGYHSGAYKFDIGSSSNYLRWDGSALSLIGDITGVSNINITGQARFGGTYTGSLGQAAVYANESLGAQIGIVGVTNDNTGNGYGVYGSSGLNTNGIGVAGNVTGSSSTGVGVQGTAHSIGSVGVLASNNGGGFALKVLGAMSIDNSSLVTNLNADKLDGNDSTDFLAAGGTAVNSSAVGGIGLAQLVVVTSAVAGSPGAATHTLNCTLNGTAFRIPVLIP